MYTGTSPVIHGSIRVNVLKGPRRGPSNAGRRRRGSVDGLLCGRRLRFLGGPFFTLFILRGTLLSGRGRARRTSSLCVTEIVDMFPFETSCTELVESFLSRRRDVRRRAGLVGAHPARTRGQCYVQNTYTVDLRGQSVMQAARMTDQGQGRIPLLSFEIERIR